MKSKIVSSLGMAMMIIPLAIQNSAYAGGDNRFDFKKEIVDPSVPKERNFKKFFGKNKDDHDPKKAQKNIAVRNGVIAASTTAVGAATSAGILTVLGTTGVLTLGATAAVGGIAALGTTGAATFGAVPAGLLVGAVVGGTSAFVTYKLHQRYKNHLMGVPSEIVAELTERAQTMKVSPDSLIDDYLKRRLDLVCKENGFDGGVNMRGTQTQKRKSDVKHKYLTAYNEKGEPEKYSYVKDYPSVIVRKLECIDTATNRVMNDPLLKQMQQEMETQAKTANSNQNVGLGTKLVTYRQSKPLVDSFGMGGVARIPYAPRVHFAGSAN